MLVNHAWIIFSIVFQVNSHKHFGNFPSGDILNSLKFLINCFLLFIDLVVYRENSCGRVKKMNYLWIVLIATLHRGLFDPLWQRLWVKPPIKPLSWSYFPSPVVFLLSGQLCINSFPHLPYPDLRFGPMWFSFYRICLCY